MALHPHMAPPISTSAMPTSMDPASLLNEMMRDVPVFFVLLITEPSMAPGRSATRGLAGGWRWGAGRNVMRGVKHRAEAIVKQHVKHARGRSPDKDSQPRQTVDTDPYRLSVGISRKSKILLTYGPSIAFGMEKISCNESSYRTFSIWLPPPRTRSTNRSWASLSTHTSRPD